MDTSKKTRFSQISIEIFIKNIQQEWIKMSYHGYKTVDGEILKAFRVN